MQKAYLEIKDSFPTSNVQILNDSLKVIFPDNVMFTTGSSEVLPDFDSKLFRFSKLLNKYYLTKILLTGHTDNIGEDAPNIRLSKERAGIVKNILVQDKVLEKRMFTWGLGEKSPIGSNDSPEGRAQNRRVEIILLFNEN